MTNQSPNIAIEQRTDNSTETSKKDDEKEVESRDAQIVEITAYPPKKEWRQSGKNRLVLILVFSTQLPRTIEPSW